MSVRRRRSIASGVAVLVGLLAVLLAAVPHPVLSTDTVVIHLSEPGDVASRFVLLLAGSSLLAAARGLGRGARAAWDVALGSTLVALLGLQSRDADGLGLLALGLMLVVLVTSRSACHARGDRPGLKQGTQLLVVGLALVYGYGVTGLYLLDAEFTGSTTFGRSLVDAARALFWLPTSTVGSSTAHGVWFVDSVRVLALIVAVGAIISFVRASRSTTATADERRLVRSILDAHGSTSLAYFTLLPDKLYAFSPDRLAFVSYKVIGNVAIVLGDTVGHPESATSAIKSFLERCQAEGLEPCAHQVTGAQVGLYRACGLSATKIGDEAVIDLSTFTLDTPSMKSVRKKTNKLRREGVVVEELVTPIDEATMGELQEVSDVWLADGGHRERSFTLGSFDREYLQATTVLVARSPDLTTGQPGRIEAFVNVLPAFHGTDGNFDLMRRRPDAPHNVIDLLFVELIERFRAQGLDGMNLGLAPLAGMDRGTSGDRAKTFLYEQGGRAFNFRGLYDFKNKWSPRWEPRFLLYRGPLGLTKVLPAVAAAGEYDDPVTRHPYLPAARGTVAAVPQSVLRGLWRGIARREALPMGLVVMIVVAVQAATIGRSGLHVRLLAIFGNSWDDLAHLRLLRLATSSLFQAEPGLRWSILALVAAAVVTVGVWVNGRRAVGLWFGVDAIASLVLFSGYRLAAAVGSGKAGELVMTRDAGSSSAALAIVTAALLTLDDRRQRVAAIAALLAAQVPLLVISGKPAYLHHVAAITATVFIVRALDARSARASPAATTRPQAETAGSSSKKPEIV